MNNIIRQVIIDKERYQLEVLIRNNKITEDDIINLMNKDDNYGITLSDQEYSKKELYLKKLFRRPYLLCDQNISDNLKKLLPLFLDRMYNLEFNELNYRLSNYICTKEEYEESLDVLNYCMYESSLDGMSIKETGMCIGISDNILKLKY